MKTDPLAAEKLTAGLVLRSVCLLVVGVVAVAAGLRLALGGWQRVYTPGLTEKQRMLEQDPTSATTAVLGSSMMEMGFDPRVFDQQMQGTGLSKRTVNMALAAGAQTEQLIIGRYWLEHFSQNPPPCMAVVELNAEAVFLLQWMTHPREINEYNAESARLSLLFPPPEREGWRRIVHYRAATLVAMLSHYAYLGMLSARIFKPELDEGLYDNATSHDRRGMLAYTPTAAEQKEVAELMARRPAAPQVVQVGISPGSVYLLEKLHEAAHGAPLRLVLYQLPTLNDLALEKVYPDHVDTSFGTVPVIDLGRPELHPEFYAPQDWLDPMHLREEPAGRVTAEFARELKAWYAAHPPAPNAGCGG